MVNMVMEATPQQVLAITSIPFAIAFALAVILYIGIEWGKFRTKMPSSILGILISVAFATGLVPWAILGEEFGLNHLLIGVLCVLGAVVLALCIRIKHLAKKPARRFPVAAYDPKMITS